MTARSSPIVLDTSVVSIVFRAGIDERTRYYLDQVAGRRPVISFQTLEEMLFGAALANWGPRRTNELMQHLDQYEVVWAGPELVQHCARLRRNRQQAGRMLKPAEAWIAATAVMLGCPLASDDRDFAGIPDLELIQSSSV